MNLRSLDLNLLVVFDAIFREGNVTRAASKVGLSQPATSNALTRLRGHLNDELFLRGPDGLRPTPRANELAPQLHAILSELEQVLDPQVFDPAKAQRDLVIAAVDPFAVVVVPELLGILSNEAPGIRVQIVPSVGLSFEALDAGDIDFAAAAFGPVADRFGKARLLEDSYSCLVRKGSPLDQKSMNLRNFAGASHILVSPVCEIRGFVDDELAKIGLTRHIGLVLNHFSAAPPVVAKSDLVLTAPTQVLNRLKTSEHVILDCPIAAPAIFRSLDLVWHDRLSRHPAQFWLRNAIVRAAQNSPP